LPLLASLATPPVRTARIKSPTRRDGGDGVKHSTPWKATPTDPLGKSPGALRENEPYKQSQTAFCSPIRTEFRGPKHWKKGGEKRLIEEHDGGVLSANAQVAEEMVQHHMNRRNVANHYYERKTAREKKKTGRLPQLGSSQSLPAVTKADSPSRLAAEERKQAAARGNGHKMCAVARPGPGGNFEPGFY
jgi:hypothetical protein